MIFGFCIKEALFFAESHMILTGFLEKENIKNEFEFRANEKSVRNKVVWYILCTCTWITYITKVNSDISMVKYYLLFLLLVERKKICRNGTKNHREEKQHMHMHYKLNKSK